LPQIQVARERDPDLPIAPIRRVADLS